MEQNNQENKQADTSIVAEIKKEERKLFKNFNYDKSYKWMFFIPFVILLVSLVYLGIFYAKTGDIIYKDVSLSGGTSITINGEVDRSQIEAPLKEKFSDVSFTRLEDITTRKQIALMVESSASPEELKPEIEKILGYKLDEKNSSTEFTGASLGKDFYRQLIQALIISFFLMAIVIFILFRTFVPSTAVIFAIFADIVMPLALIDFLGMKVSAAGIAAFLMLIGYSVDTDILLTSRALKSKEGSLNSRIFRAFKTGSLMTLTALAAVLPAFFIVTGLPDSFRQIFLILALGLFGDLINTWLTNASIIKWYCTRKGIQ
ncbi:MAG: protein translocase subunit SecF [Nanoarchaeota archaeon]